MASGISSHTGEQSLLIAVITDSVSTPKVNTAKEKFRAELRDLKNFKKATTSARAMQSSREKLPAYKVKTEYLKAVANNQVLYELRNKMLNHLLMPRRKANCGSMKTCQMLMLALAVTRGMYTIIGKRYKCKDCKEAIGFDLCKVCYNTNSKLPGRFNQQHTPDHQFELNEWQMLYRILRFRPLSPEGPHELPLVFVADDDPEGQDDDMDDTPEIFDHHE